MKYNSFCDSIEEYSLHYLEDELSAKEKSIFMEHICKCDTCKKMFNLIKRNYHPESKVNIKNNAISSSIDALIDKNRYPLPRNIGKPFSRKQVILVAALVILCAFVTVNAKSIYKSYKELANLMFIDKSLLGENRRIYTGMYSDEEYVKGVYSKYEDQIKAHLARMKTAEISRLEFEDEGKTFEVSLAKGVKGDFISYGFKGYALFENDFTAWFNEKCYSDMATMREYQSIDEMLGVTKIAPIPGYIPDGFKMIRCGQLLSKGTDINTPNNIAITYENDNKDSFAIGLTRSRIVDEVPGMADEVAKATGLPKTADRQSDNSDGQNSDISNVNKQEAINIGNNQALFMERTLNAAGNEINQSKIFRSINIYLGDEYKLPILRIDSPNLGKEELIKIAENITIANLPDNQIRAQDYFRGIKDEKILALTEEYLNNIRSGRTKFTIQVDDNTEFYRFSHNDAYYIKYRETDLNEIKPYLELPIKLNYNVLESFELDMIQIIGRPYSERKTEAYMFKKGDIYLSAHADRAIYASKDIELTDQLIGMMTGVKNSIKPFFDKSGHLYYINIDLKNCWIVNTMYEENSLRSNCSYHIDRKVIKNEEELQEFINGLE